MPAISAQIAHEPSPSHIKKITTAGLKRVNLIDATPIGANIRSTVATYSNVLDDLRKIFANTAQAKSLTLKAADFSYNTGSLRCPECDGTGQITMDVQFLPDVVIPCPKCQGLRYDKKALKIKSPLHDGLEMDLARLLAQTISEVLGLIPQKTTALMKKVREKLLILDQLGLGYLTLNEGTPLLSGGEAQRLKLAYEMGKTQDDALYIFDEPTIGLHPLDVKRLIQVFDQLIKAKATVIVIEHDLDVLANCDYCIDMGPFGGEEGGLIVYHGCPKYMKDCPDSITGKYLQ